MPETKTEMMENGEVASSLVVRVSSDDLLISPDSHRIVSTNPLRLFQVASLSHCSLSTTYLGITYHPLSFIYFCKIL
jgi:hypothetical protein